MKDPVWKDTWESQKGFFSLIDKMVQAKRKRAETMNPLLYREVLPQ